MSHFSNSSMGQSVQRKMMIQALKQGLGGGPTADMLGDMLENMMKSQESGQQMNAMSMISAMMNPGQAAEEKKAKKEDVMSKLSHMVSRHGDEEKQQRQPDMQDMVQRFMGAHEEQEQQEEAPEPEGPKNTIGHLQQLISQYTGAGGEDIEAEQRAKFEEEQKQKAAAQAAAQAEAEAEAAKEEEEKHHGIHGLANKMFHHHGKKHDDEDEKENEDNARPHGDYKVSEVTQESVSVSEGDGSGGAGGGGGMEAKIMSQGWFGLIFSFSPSVSPPSFRARRVHG